MNGSTFGSLRLLSKNVCRMTVLFSKSLKANDASSCTVYHVFSGDVAGGGVCGGDGGAGSLQWRH